MRNLTTDDIRKILIDTMDIAMYRGQPLSEMNDDEIVDVFGFVLKQCYSHANSRHYSNFLDEPRY